MSAIFPSINPVSEPDCELDLDLPLRVRKLTETSLNTSIERFHNLIQQRLNYIGTRQAHHKIRYIRQNKLLKVVNVLIAMTQAFSISSIVVELTEEEEENVFTYLALCLGSFSLIMNAFKMSLRLEEQKNRHRLTYTQLASLAANTESRILHSNITSSDLELLVSHVDTQLDIIRDYEL